MKYFDSNFIEMKLLTGDTFPMYCFDANLLTETVVIQHAYAYMSPQIS